VALGNCAFDEEIYRALSASLADATPMVQEHISWALAAQDKRRPETF